MSDNEIVKIIKTQLYNWALEDVKGASEKAKMGGFILASCLIDYLANFYSKENKSSDRYVEFCSTYLLSYIPKDLYKSLRCKLVHNYTEGGKYVFTDNNEQFYLKPYRNKKIILNLENFIEDIENAMDQYFIDVKHDSVLKKRMINKFNKFGILFYTHENKGESLYSVPLSAAAFDDKEGKFKSLFSDLGKK